MNGDQFRSRLELNQLESVGLLIPMLRPVQHTILRFYLGIFGRFPEDIVAIRTM